MNEAKKKRRLTMKQKRAIAGLSFILPWLIGFLWFYVRSLVMTTQFSLSSISVGVNNAAGYVAEFIGFDNYKYAFTEHGTFKQIFTTSMLDLLVDVPMIIFFSLFVAMLLNRKFKGRTFFRVIFFLPVILNSGAINSAIEMARAMMVGGVSPTSPEMMESIGSTSNVNVSYFIGMFTELGLPSVLLEYVVGAVARINAIVTASGVQIVIFISALQAVPTTLYEVSKIEGATGYETFWKVTFPMVSPLIITNVVYTVIDAFANSPVITLSYSTIFTRMNYALGSAMSLVSMVSVLALLLAVCTLISKRTFYYN